MLELVRRLVFVVSLACASVPANAQVRDYRLSHQFAVEIDARDRAARVFADEVRKRITNITFSIYGNSTLKIAPAEQLNALLDGRIELAIYPLFYGSKQIPEFSIGLLPGIPADVPSANRLKGTDFDHRLQAIAGEHGIHILGWWWLGGGIVSRTADVGGPATFRGLRVRGGDDGFDLMLSAAEGRVLSMASTEIAANMRNGELDVTMTSFESLVSFRLFETAKAATVGGYGLWTSFQPLVMSKFAWDRLSEQEQEAFTQAAEVSDAYFEKSQIEAEKAAIDAFTKAGARVRQMYFDEYADWLRLAKDSSWRRYRDLGPQASSLLNTMMQSLIDSKTKN